MNTQKTSTRVGILWKLLLAMIVMCLFAVPRPAYAASLDYDGFENGLRGWNIYNPNGVGVDTTLDSDPNHNYELRVTYNNPNAYLVLTRQNINNYSGQSNLVYQIEFWDDPNRPYGLDFYVASASNYAAIVVNDNQFGSVYYLRNGAAAYNTGIRRSIGWHTFQIFVTDSGGYCAVDGTSFSNLFVNPNITHATAAAIEYPNWGKGASLSYWDNFKVYDRMYAISTVLDDPITGMYSRIEVADPAVVNGHSLETNWIIEGSQWIELGWIKYPDGRRLFYSYCANCGVDPWGYHGNASCCSAHAFQLWYDNVNGRWGLYIDGSNVRLVSTNFSKGNTGQIGGEVIADRRNQIGTSGLLSIGYWKNWGAQWVPWNGREGQDIGYWINRLWGTTNNLQNGTY